MNGQVARRDGIALWRQIADDLRQQARDGSLGGDGRLPTEFELAARYGVNRHTVRSAIALLVQEGLLRSEQGRGTFLVKAKRLSYPLARRTRFSTGLEGQGGSFRSTLLDSGGRAASEEMAATLGIDPEAPLVWLRVGGVADGTPISVADHWFPADRFRGIEAAFVQTGSITAALARHGVADYTRRSSTVTATLAGEGDMATLRLAPGAVVLQVAAVNVDPAGIPIQFSRTRFAADRVELSIVNAVEPPTG